jgi:hypothetical protein
VSGDTLERDLGPWSMVPEWVTDSEISDGAHRLYAILARICGDKRVGWPSRSTLAKRARCSPDTVDRRVKELIEIGALTVEARFDEKGDRTSNLYRVRVIDPGRNGAATPTHERGDGGRVGAATGGRVGAAENETKSERDTLNEGEADASQQRLLDPPKKERRRDPIYDALASVFPSATRSEGSLIGVAAADLKKLTPVPEPEEIVRRARAARREWPTCTAKAVAQRWTDLGKLGAPAIESKFSDLDDDYEERKGRNR